MRLQPFFDVLGRYLPLDNRQISYFTTNPNFIYGWEGFLQASIDYAFSRRPNVMSQLRREEYYPSLDPAKPLLTYNAGNAEKPVDLTSDGKKAARCDFRITSNISQEDPTYVELKCRKSTETVDEAWARHWDDCRKIAAIGSQNPTLSCIALLSTYGTFSTQAINAIHQNMATRKIASLSMRVLDYGTSPPANTNWSNFQPGGNDRALLVGVALA